MRSSGALFPVPYISLVRTVTLAASRLLYAFYGMSCCSDSTRPCLDPVAHPVPIRAYILYLGVSVLAYCLAHRTDKLSARGESGVALLGTS
jgi:hypothetical protein